MNVSGGGLSYFVEKDLTALGFRLLLLGPPKGNELDLLAALLDLERIAGFEAQLGGVGLAHDHVVDRRNAS